MPEGNWRMWGEHWRKLCEGGQESGGNWMANRVGDLSLKTLWYFCPSKGQVICPTKRYEPYFPQKGHNQMAWGICPSKWKWEVVCPSKRHLPFVCQLSNVWAICPTNRANDFSFFRRTGSLSLKKVSNLSLKKGRWLLTKKRRRFVSQKGHVICPSKGASNLSLKNDRCCAPQKWQVFVPQKGQVICPSKWQLSIKEDRWCVPQKGQVVCPSNRYTSVICFSQKGQVICSFDEQFP